MQYWDVCSGCYVTWLTSQPTPRPAAVKRDGAVAPTDLALGWDRASAPLDEVAHAMSEKKVGSVIVNDEDGKFLGIFTVTDALNALIEIVRKGNTLGR